VPAREHDRSERRYYELHIAERRSRDAAGECAMTSSTRSPGWRIRAPRP
jgi:hypothetical protein